MDWNDLRYLLAIHRRGSLARAAAEIGVTKATASRRLAALEEAIGVPLVERRPEGMTLTDAGRTVLVTAEAMERAAAELDSRLAVGATDTPTGVVRLTVPPWLGERLFIPALSRLRARYPELEVRILGTNDLLDIAKREADVAVRNVRPADGPFKCQRVAELCGCVYGADLYLERRGTPADRDALLTHDLLAYDRIAGMPGFEWIAEPPFASRIVFRAGDPVGLAAAAAAGLGLAAVPCLVGETEPRLHRIEALGVGFSPLFVVTHEEITATARVRAVVRFIQEVMRANEDILMGRSSEQSA